MSVLITGASGGLGSKVVEFLSQYVESSTIIATSRNPDNASQFKTKGMGFRVVDFDEPSRLKSTFDGVEKLMVISTMEYDTEKRAKAQKNAIDAAVAGNVKHVYFTSAAWGGYGDSDVYIQQATLMTEKYLKKFMPLRGSVNGRRSGLTYTIIRNGAYAHEFAEFVNYKPDVKEIVTPGDGKVAWVDRGELGEGTARIISAPSAKYAIKQCFSQGQTRFH